MILSFELTMPGVASWNGIWTQSQNPHFRTRKVSKETGISLLEGKEFENYSYAWSDGWRANVEVKRIDGKTRKKLEKITVGFSGYDWMINSILSHGAIYASNDEIPNAEGK
jgi:hypothetical protein